MKKTYRRGYAVALLIGIDETQTAIWKIYSNVVKLEKNIRFENSRKDAKSIYNLHESIINALRLSISEGVKSIVVTSPPRTSYAQEFLNHLQAHHIWLVQGSGKATFGLLSGSAISIHDVATLKKTSEFKKIVGETTEVETENLLELLEKRLNNNEIQPLVIYSLQEAEDAILGSWSPGKPKPEILLLTTTYLSGSHQKGRVQRLIQVATNRGIQTRTVDSNTAFGKRLLQLGGLVCILKST